MPERRGVVLSFVERGWQAAREWSLEADRQEITVVHLLKGWLDPGVRALVSPKAHIRLVRMPRQLFWPAAWGWVAWGVCSGTLQAILVDNDRSLRRVSTWVRGARVELRRLPEPSRSG
jgi:hypothetical protein